MWWADNKPGILKTVSIPHKRAHVFIYTIAFWLVYHNSIQQKITFLKVFEQHEILTIIDLKQLQNYFVGLLYY